MNPKFKKPLIGCGGVLAVVIALGIFSSISGTTAPEQAAPQAEQAAGWNQATGEVYRGEDPSLYMRSFESQEAFEQFVDSEKAREAEDALALEVAEEQEQERLANLTPEERIEDSMESLYGDSLRSVNTTQDGERLMAAVEIDGRDNLTSGMTRRGMEADTLDGYEALYTGQVKEEISIVRISVYFPTMDEMGNESETIVYNTFLEREIAEQVNWNNADSLNWPEIWTEMYVLPELREN